MIPIYILVKFTNTDIENFYQPLYVGTTHNKFTNFKRNIFGHDWWNCCRFRAYEAVRQSEFYSFFLILFLRRHNSPMRTFASQWTSPNHTFLFLSFQFWILHFLISVCTLVQELFLSLFFVDSLRIIVKYLQYFSFTVHCNIVPNPIQRTYSDKWKYV